MFQFDFASFCGIFFLFSSLASSRDEKKILKLLMHKLCDNPVQTVYRASSPKCMEIFALEMVFGSATKWNSFSEFFFFHSLYFHTVSVCVVAYPSFMCAHRNGNYVKCEMVSVCRRAELSGMVLSKRACQPWLNGFVHLGSFVVWSLSNIICKSIHQVKFM